MVAAETVLAARIAMKRYFNMAMSVVLSLPGAVEYCCYNKQDHGHD